jgi:hypothetical protein
MITYVYELENGERREVKQSIKDDALTTIDGVPCRRVPQSPAVSVPRGFIPYASRQLPRFFKHADNHDSRGRPLIKSKSDEDRLIGRSKDDSAATIVVERET